MRLWKQILCVIRQKNYKAKDSKYVFEKLSLTEDVDISVYEDAIEFAFTQPDIKNIAFSGAYGSGKSSVLASYKKKHPHRKFLHISLAHFIPERKDGNTHTTHADNTCCKNNQCTKHKTTTEEKDRSKTTTSALEGKILNQLIHQLDTKDIPQTNFRVKSTTSLWSVIWNAIAITALITCFLHMILSQTWVDFVYTFSESELRSFLENFTTPMSFFASGIIVFSICTFYIYSAVKAQRYKAAIRKLSLQGNEIELFEESNDSFFDKYLNEILYLFENADIDAIVFEDMDRYEMEAIFERLREVNTLVNIRLAKRGRRVIRFIFMLRDDIFVSKDRTKFFDYIIPIVPVIDASNSYDQLSEHLKRNKIRQDFSDAFLQGISLYIDDMRLLKNICNEYVIYHSRLGDIDLDPERLLALITYKNIYPRDFGQLQHNLGYVHAVFASKPGIINKQISSLEDELSQLSQFIQSATEENLKSQTEIMRAYAVEHLPEYAPNLRRMSDSSLDATLRRVLSGAELNEYIDRINRASVRGLFELQCSRKEIEQRILSIKGMRLYEIIPHEDGPSTLDAITRFEEGTQQDYKEIKESQYFDLLKYLILNGYLDESYPDYMTYFYPHNLTRKDKIFLRRVLDRNGHDYSYSLDNPQLVVSKLRVSDFDYDEILNNDLLEYLLKHNPHSEQTQHFLAQLEKNRNFHFLSQFLECTSEKEKFVQAFAKQWPGFFDDIVRKGEMTHQEIRQYSIDTLYYCNGDQLVSVNIGDSLTKYISNSPDYLNIVTPRIDKLISAFKLLDVRFQSINLNLSDWNLFKEIYQESLYAINMENILLMLVAIHGLDDDKSKLLSSNYSHLSLFSESPIYHYIESYIDDYMGVWLDTYRGEIEDQESCAVALLNHPRISHHFKETYIERLVTVITSIHSIHDKSLWKLLLDRKRIAYTEENIITYWSTEKKLDSATISYINEYPGTINFSTCRKSTPETVLNEFFTCLAKCNDINNKQYKDCILSLGFSWGDEFNISGLSIDKVKILAKNHILRVTPATLRFLRSNYSAAVPMYIESNIDEYANIMTSQLMDQTELLMILDWNVATDTKKALIDIAPSSISIIGQDYSSEICVHILQKKPSANDVPKLFASFDSQPAPIKDHMYTLAVKNIDAIIRGTITTTTELKCRVLSDDQITDSVKQRLLISIIKSLPQDEVKLCLDAAKRFEFSKVFNPRMRPRIGNNAQCKEILDGFKSRGWIAGYSLSENGSGYEIQRLTPPKKRH